MSKIVTKSIKTDSASKSAISASCQAKPKLSSHTESSQQADIIQYLQRKLGNRGVERLVQSGYFQTKLNIGPANDKYEQEADQVADKVVSMKTSEPFSGGDSIQTKIRPPANTITQLRRKTDVTKKPEEEEIQGEFIQFKCGKCQEENKEAKIRRRAILPSNLCPKCRNDFFQSRLQASLKPGQSLTAPDSIETNIRSVQGRGRSMSKSERNYFEPRFGADFSHVKIHTGSQANYLAKSVNARAFTVGSDIFFGSSQYNSQTTEGKKLMAHELTHTVQQNGQVGLKVMRVPSESGIKDNGYSYSTHCGWIDWGHTNPGLARTLIAQVREASMRIARREKSLQKRVNASLPSFISQPRCRARYERNEVAMSQAETPQRMIHELNSGAVEIRVGGFGVGSSDLTKMVSTITSVGNALPIVSQARGRRFKVEVYGFTDCLGREHKNSRLRSSRQSGGLALLFRGISQIKNAPVLEAELKTTSLSNYLVDNSSRAGRKMNRGVMFRLIPQVTPEQFTTTKMSSRALGMTVSGVTPTVELNRSLSNEEALSVALGIFLLQSVGFERLQSWTDALAHSSFSEEDLTSNLISFYRAAKGYSSREIRNICDVWNHERSINRLNTVPLVKNYVFRPPSLPSGGRWPQELNTIRPIHRNSPLYNVTEMLYETLILNFRVPLR